MYIENETEGGHTQNGYLRNQASRLGMPAKDASIEGLPISDRHVPAGGLMLERDSRGGGTCGVRVSIRTIQKKGKFTYHLHPIGGKAGSMTPLCRPTDARNALYASHLRRAL